MNTPARNPVVEEDLRILFRDSFPWERLSGRSVMVTGATGLVAAYLIEVLLYRNEVVPGPPCTVLALVRNKSRAAARFAHYSSRADLQLVVQDVTTPLSSQLAPDFIIHAAGNATPRLFAADPVGTYEAAVLGTHHLLKHAYEKGCESFLLVSSGAVHGAISDEHPVMREDIMGIVDPLDRYACYAESKRIAETMCASWTRQFGVSAKIARLGHTYGPGLQREDDRAFSQFVYSIVDRHDIVLHTDGSAVRPYCYLSDATAALLRVLLLGQDGEAYLLANATASCSVLELARLLAELFPDRGVHVRCEASQKPDAVVSKQPARQLDTSKLGALGWTPKIGVREGFHRTLRSLL